MEMYWQLQWRRFNRHLTEFGLPPVAGYVVLLLVFAGFSAFLFCRFTYAAYIYALLALSVTTVTSEAGRVSFLRQHWDDTTYRKIRWMENGVLILPFVMVLLVMQEWLVAAGLIVTSGLMTLSSMAWTFQFTLPTPFSQYPFEFATGFRKSYLLILVALFLQVMAVLHQNANLALFALGAVCFICLTFYTQTENPYWVWIHAMSPARFLWHKIRIASGYGSVMCLPFVIVPVVFFPAQSGFAFLVYGLGMIYLVTALLGKYAFFPAPMNVPQGIMLAIAFWFPPLLLFLLPYFYRRAVHQLKPILPC